MAKAELSGTHVLERRAPGALRRMGLPDALVRAVGSPADAQAHQGAEPVSCHGPLYDLVYQLGVIYNGNALSLLRDWQEKPARHFQPPGQPWEPVIYAP